MRRFMLFVFEKYEARGGGADLTMDFDTKEQAEDYLYAVLRKEDTYLLANILDTKSGELQNYSYRDLQ